MPICYLHGHGTLAYQAAERLHQAGFELAGCCSPDGSMAQWCEAANVRYWDDPDAFRAHLLATQTQIDLLVNTDSSWPIEAAIVEKARSDVFQFHPSLLPRYQGAHSATWAMLQGELWHGLTWQSLKRAARGDPSCLQKTLDIYPNDTINTLNSRLQEQALERFDALLLNVLSKPPNPVHTEAPTVSNLPALNFIMPEGEASRYEASAKPPTLGLLPLTQTAGEIRNLVRALDYGPVANPVTTAKLWLNNQANTTSLLVTVSTAQIGEATSMPAGTLVAIDQGQGQGQNRDQTQVNALQIASADRLVTVSGLRHSDGSTLTVEQLAAAGITPGLKLPSPSAAELERLHSRSEAVAPWESQLVARCAAFEPCLHPLIPMSPSAGGTQPHQADLKGCPDGQRIEMLIAAFALYWLRSTQQTQASLGVYVAAHRPDAGSTAGLETQLFMPHTLLPVSMGSSSSSASAPHLMTSFADFQQQLLTELRHTQTLTLAQDVMLRYPILAGFDAAQLGAVSLWLADQPPTEHQITHYFKTPQRRLLLVAHAGAQLYGAPDLDPVDFGRVVEQLQTLANAAQTNPLSAISQLTWVPPAEQRQLLNWGHGEYLELPDQTMTQVIAQVAQQHPQQQALLDSAGACTYQALLEQSAQVAHWLAHQGIGTQDSVALCVSRSRAYLIWMFGIMRCGAAFIPIDPASPLERLSYLLQDSQAKLLVCDAEIATALSKLKSSNAALSLPVCIPAQMNAALDSLPKSYREEADHPAQRAAYVIYTSGSTGNPKGVAVSHRNLLNHALSIAARFATDSNTRLLQSASIGFDVSMEQIFPALLRGGSVVLGPDKVLQDMTALEQTIAEQQVTHLTLPTGFWATWLETLQRSGQLLPESIRCVATGTEKVLPKHIALWDSLSAAHVKLLQGYGPTETTVTSVMYAHERMATDTRQPTGTGDSAVTMAVDIPIGRPLANTYLYVVDRYHQLVPAGFPGELLIGGAGVAQGYLGKPEMTAARFIVNPVITAAAMNSAQADSARVYCTGDQVVWNANGQLVFLGRQDNQFKIRGYRVEPGEIEAALAALPQVEQAAVMPTKDEHGTVKIVAYLVQQADAWDPQRVQLALAATLPHYMIPEIILFLDAMPLMINGKLDRKALPTPALASATDDSAYSEPCTEHEKIVAALWQQWLSHARISRHDNFFALGGDSLRAVAIINQLKTRHQLSLSLADFFVDARLTAICEKLQSTAQASPYTIVPLNDHQHGTPIFFICGVQGYSKIAAQLSQPRPAYGLFLGREMAYLSDEVEDDVNIERYALTYLDAITTVQSSGPYILAGHSFGGMLAFEIARLLRQRGETVALLALLDPVLPNASYFNAVYFLKRVFQNLYRDPSLLIDQITRRLRRLNPFKTEVAHVESATNTHALKALRNRRYELAIDAYDAEVHTYAGDVVLFRVQEAQRQEYYRKIHPLLGWQRHVTGRIVTEDLIETHEELTHKPQDIASKLDRYLAGL